MARHDRARRYSEAARNQMYSFPILELLQDCEDPPATPESLEELEIELGVRFPKEYADFLLQFNGGHFMRPVRGSLPNPTKWINTFAVNSFFGDPSDRSAGGTITQFARMLAGRIPDDCLAITHCNGGDLVLLQVAGPASERGKVWFWDETQEGEGDNIHWLADSFSEFLVMLEYDTDVVYEECETIPIFLSIENGRLRAVEQFLSQGGDVETRNADGKTLIAAAAWYSWPKIVRLLLEHSADPNAPDLKGRTPLHHAAGASYDSMKLILAAGADATVRDLEGNSVLAGWSYRADQILRAHGAAE
jgi:hypothetical protein